MPVHNADVSAVFEEIADLLEIEAANPFRIRAYRKAARVLNELPQDVRILLKNKVDLTQLPGIGDDLAAKIIEIVNTGNCSFLQRLHQELPSVITDLLHLPGLGPKRVKALYHHLGVQNLEQLQQAAQNGLIRTIPGFGEKTEHNILKATGVHASQMHRFKLATAAQYADALSSYLKHIKGVHHVTVAGSFRRMRETVGDLDVLVTADDHSPVMQQFIKYDEVAEVLSAGITRATVLLKCNMQVDLRLTSKGNYGSALHYFTGSKAHNIAIRRIAQKLGLKINEYGVFRGGDRIAGETEESVFHAIALPYIPPELREDRGEIKAAIEGRLPKLVELTDLKGDLHVHTRASDGNGSLQEMVEAARSFGFKYIAITEHSRHLAMVHGLDASGLLRQCDEIEQLNLTLSTFTVLKGIEVDILEDGSLDLPNNVLGRLDLVIGAVHSKFNLSRAKQTKRILKAMDHPHFTVLAHPTGRLLEKRQPYDVDMSKIIRHAKNRGCFLELNAQPERLDLMDTYCQKAKDEGVMICVNSDAHSPLDFSNLQFGIGQARRGWLEKKDLLNTQPLTDLLALIKRTM